MISVKNNNNNNTTSSSNDDTNNSNNNNNIYCPQGYLLVEFFGTHDFGWVRADSVSLLFLSPLLDDDDNNNSNNLLERLSVPTISVGTTTTTHIFYLKLLKPFLETISDCSLGPVPCNCCCCCCCYSC